MSELISIEAVANKIFFIRSVKVMLDRDLAELYGVETRVLNQAVRRNIKRFPEDFMFALTRDEIMRISQIVTSSDIKYAKQVHAHPLILSTQNRFTHSPSRGLPCCPAF